MLEESGVGVELTRSAYEAGEWAGAVREAWLRGKARKAQQRAYFGPGGTKRRPVSNVPNQVVEWVEEWWRVEDAV